MKQYNILVINPGSTSTQVGIFQNKKNVLWKNPYPTLWNN